MTNYAAMIFMTKKVEFKTQAVEYLREPIKKNYAYALYISIFYLANKWAT